MSRDLNETRIIGRLTRDPELKYTTEGTALCTFSVAANKRWKAQGSGEDREHVEYFNLVAWNKLGETCGQYLKKGSRVYLEAEQQTRSWDDRTTGEKRYRVEHIVNDMIMLDAAPRPGVARPEPDDVGDASLDGPEPEATPTRQDASTGKPAYPRPASTSIRKASTDDMPF